MFSLKWNGGVIAIDRSKLTQMSLFRKNPKLVNIGSYTVQSNVDGETLMAVVSKLHDARSEFNITEANYRGLRAVCQELGVSLFDDQLQQFESDSIRTYERLNHEIRELKERCSVCDRRMDAFVRIVKALEHQIKESHASFRVGQLLLEDLSSTVDKITTNWCD